jgi:hypothetical protein
VPKSPRSGGPKSGWQRLRPAGAAGGGRRPWREPKIAAAAAAVVLIAGIAAVLLSGGSHPSQPAATGRQEADLGAGSSSQTPPAGSASAVSPPASQPAGHPSPRGKRKAATSVAISPAPTLPPPATTPPVKGNPSPAPGSPSPRPKTTSPSSPPAPGTLQISTGAISLTSVDDGASVATFTLTAVGGPVSYSLSISGGNMGGVIATPQSGTLAAGQQVVVTVQCSSKDTFTDYLTFSPGGQTVRVVVKAVKKKI